MTVNRCATIGVVMLGATLQVTAQTDEASDAMKTPAFPVLAHGAPRFVSWAGALDENEYREKLEAVGFEQISIEPTRVYRVEDASEFLSSAGVDVKAIAPQVDGKFMSAFVRAVKPMECCRPDCCN